MEIKERQPFKIGDSIYLEKHYKHETEFEDYSTNIPLNKELIVKNIKFCTNVYGNDEKEWVVYLKDYDLGHPAVKFKTFKEESLVGRYVKVLKNNTYGTTYKKDNIFELINKNGSTTCSQNYNYPHREDYETIEETFKKYGFQLMPSGWTPEQEQKPFKFNIGDEVKTNNQGFECSKHTDKYKINSCFYNRNFIIKDRLFDIHTWYLLDGHGNWITEEGLELVSEVKQEQSIIPEYVELLLNFDSHNTGKIFYTKEPIPKMENWIFNSWEDVFKNHSEYFKKSTKEAYDLQNQPNSVDMKEIQAECKKRFPVGCTFVNTEGDEYTLKDDSEVYKIVDDMIYASKSDGLLYKDGIYAELVSLPVENFEFKVGDYVYHEGNKQFYKITELLKYNRFKAESGYCHDTEKLMLDYCRKALPHEIPRISETIKSDLNIGDEVENDGKIGIVIGIRKDNPERILVKGILERHPGRLFDYIKGGPSDKNDSYFYNKSQLKLIKKDSIIDVMKPLQYHIKSRFDIHQFMYNKIPQSFKKPTELISINDEDDLLDTSISKVILSKKELILE